MFIEKEIRDLARSYYWQRLYQSSKEISGINLFENIDNFSGLQVLFLYWLSVYSMLYSELSNKEWENLDQEVIKDSVRTDAFLYWRSKEIEKQIRDNKKVVNQNIRSKKSTPAHAKPFNIYKGPKNKVDK